eukprot:CAMPEP_0170486608 /NCGR_PEP_ID=MMETSP0208-20121228/5574_1 /TAXON_ID=197538 /ORGANISM="Strombidium inclinatum, Strain S3" /LENGTH=112 /DNA_ID=CAMNT_0010760591 /DNA_START=231 /DNA_END=570 /DNA_ORIENTATION=+
MVLWEGGHRQEYKFLDSVKFYPFTSRQMNKLYSLKSSNSTCSVEIFLKEEDVWVSEKTSKVIQCRAGETYTESFVFPDYKAEYAITFKVVAETQSPGSTNGLQSSLEEAGPW